MAEKKNKKLSAEEAQDNTAEQQPAEIERLYLLSIAYFKTFPNAPQIDLSADEQLDLKPSYDFVFRSDGPEKIPALSELYRQLKQSLALKQKLTLLDNYLKTNGNHPAVMELLYSWTVRVEDRIPTDLATRIMEIYPDFLHFRFFHASTLVFFDRYKEVGDLLGPASTLRQFASQRADCFSEDEWIAFYCAMGVYCTAKGELGYAIEYALKMARSRAYHQHPLVIQMVLYVSQALNKKLANYGDAADITKA